MKLIYLEWVDAVANANRFDEEQAEWWHRNTHFLIKECGWLVKEDKEGITLASRYKEEDGNTSIQWGGLQRVPKTWIKKRIDLTKKVK